MPRIVITAETGCDIPAAEAAELGVTLVPMHVSVGEKTLDDGEISPAEMLEQCRQLGVLPRTSGCTPHDFQVAFDRIHEADPEVVEEWKWVKPSSGGTAVWSHDGGICTGEVYKSVVKLTFFRGASLDDPSGLFNSSLGGNVRRAIDFREGESIDEKGLKALVRAAVRLNEAKAR